MLIIPPASLADVTKEVTYLLNYIETSDCEFIRNGKKHDAQEAVKHIKKKYNYLKKKIKSTDDFIRRAATKSSISGKPYVIICGGREMKTADWLHAELRRYHSQLGTDR